MDLLSAFEELECWHAIDSAGLSSLGVCININLHQGGILSNLLRELGKFWGDHLAWRAPGGGEINHYELFVLENFVEFGFGGKFLWHLTSCEKVY